MPAARRASSTEMTAERVAKLGFTLLGVTPPLAGYVLLTLSQDIVAAPVQRHSCGLGALALVLAIPVVVFGFVATAALLRALARAAGRRLLRPWMQTLAIAVTAFGVFLVGSIALTRHADPTVDSYLSSLPAVDRLELDTSSATAHTGPSWGIELTRASRDGTLPGCSLRLTAPPVDVQTHLRSGITPQESDSVGEVPDCAPVDVLHDEPADLFLVVHAADRAPILAIGRGKDGPVAVNAASLGPRLRPSLLGPSVGLLFAVALLVASRLARARRVKLSAVEATHRGAGWVDLGEGSPVHLPAAAPLAVGPVLLDVASVGPEACAAPYRANRLPQICAVRPGSLEDARAALRDRGASLWTWALLAAVLAVVPLAVARYVGM